MSFSEDDSLLATASGDQSARVVDMSTQTTISILGNHSASLKQVRFQPGANNNSVLATSSRDGSVQIWDLRCRGNDGPQLPMHIPAEETSRVSTRSASRKFLYGRAINSIYYAHRPWSQNAQTAFPTDAPSRGEVPGRIGDLSVTAIQFLPPGQEHLLLTASEADASVRLWDIRLLHNRHKRPQMPISITKQPQSHSQWRHFGVSSLNLSGDGSRLYTLCKDNTIYAYSTSHLILGHAPELSATSQGRPGPQRRTQEGFGPMYGFRHPQLHATSFYVKSAIRKAKDGRSEMLAVGSSDGCAILFPTDERYLPMSDFRESQDMGFGLSLLRRPTLRRVGSGLGLGDRVEESIPISTNGTPLIRGHDREVGSLTWTSEGGLITVGDDFLVRCWREGGDARDLRMSGESEGRRWGCGWADVNEKYDEADD
jgi:WD40 repeat protein